MFSTRTAGRWVTKFKAKVLIAREIKLQNKTKVTEILFQENVYIYITNLLEY